LAAKRNLYGHIPKDERIMAPTFTTSFASQQARLCPRQKRASLKQSPTFDLVRTEP